MIELIWTIPLFPLLGFLVNGFVGRRYGVRLQGTVASLMMAASFVVSLLAVITFARLGGHHAEVSLGSWMAIGNLSIDFAFLLDPLSSVMILVVSGVGCLIHIYSIGYMAHDPDSSRYFAFLNLFAFFMLTLVLGNNFLVMFLGWEGVGLCSYLLIGFWFTRDSAANAGMKAFVVNRIGDFGMLIAVFLIFLHFGSLHFGTVFERAVMTGGGAFFTAIGLLLFLGATGKSAQIPLYVWLPDAMEGPTPVSALIHAATMVTAGVYMVARCAVIFAFSPVALATVAVIGAATALMAGTIALVQNDIKRVLAYSTVSQLGYMFLACGVAAFGAGIFHLMTHAFFKALLFLGAGSVIHAMADRQDLRDMGGLKSQIPITHKTFLVATVAIAGIPPLAGFVSKDEILWKSFSSPQGHPLLWVLGTITAILTAFYMFRLLYLAFYGKSRVPAEVQPHESPPSMTVPLVILAVLSVVGGWIGWPGVLGGGAWFEHWLAPVFEPAQAVLAAGHSAAQHSHALEYGLMALSVVGALVGIFIAARWYLKRPELSTAVANRFAGFHKLWLNKYWVDELYHATVVNPVVKGALALWRWCDVAIVDGAVNGTAKLAMAIGRLGATTATGRFRVGGLLLVVGCIVGLVWAIAAQP